MEGRDIPNDPDPIRDELLARWLTGELSPAEEKELMAQMSPEQLDRLQTITDASSTLQAPAFDKDQAWQNLTAAIAAEPAPEETPVVSLPARRRRWVAPLIAASVALLAYVIITKPWAGLNTGEENYRYIVSKGAGMSGMLPDGSTVRLRGNSQIRYSEADWESNREVELKGEAYFVVKKGERFRVTTENGSVAVLGTRFEVNSDQDTLEVACYSGKVQVSDDEDRVMDVLKPGDSWAKRGKRIEESSVSDQLPAWAVKTMEFEKEEVEDVVEAIAFEFDVDIDCDGCEGRRFSGSFSNDNLSQALETLQLVSGLELDTLGQDKYRLK